MVKKITFLILFAILLQFHLVWAYDGNGQINGLEVIIPEFSNSNCRNG